MKATIRWILVAAVALAVHTTPARALDILEELALDGAAEHEANAIRDKKSAAFYDAAAL